MTTVKERVAALQSAMTSHDIDIYIVPSSDPHLSEYVSEHFLSRTYITGFTGSAGTAVFTKDFAGLFTDGRYFIQAERELEGSDIYLFRQGMPGVRTMLEWIYDNLEDGMTLGFDGRLYANQDIDELRKSLTLKNIQITTNIDLIEGIWNDRPGLPDKMAFAHPIKYAGLTVKEKLEGVIADMKKKDADAYILTGLNDIAWLFNLRGSDVESTPVVYAYATIIDKQVKLYIDRHRMTDEILDSLSEANVEILPYNSFYDSLNHLLDRIIYMDGNKVNARIFEAVKNSNRIINDNDLVYMTKAKFNETELKHMTNAHIKDGIAIVKSLKWIDDNLKLGLTELDVQNKLAYYRSEQDDFIEPSFGTISAYAGNAAMMHYSTDVDNSPVIDQKGLLLLDSGGHYLDGTTDITRTIAVGPTTEEERKDFTLVLKGHIALCETIFLHGCSGTNLDAIARRPIWQALMDYKSGTGHSVGYVLSVHEGPARIRMNNVPFVLEPGMVITNEPGIYKKDKHGIRIENILVVRKHTENDDGIFLCFENITVCPIDRKCLDLSLLNAEEKAWLNNYHAYVYETLSPHLDTEINQWLKEATLAI